MTKEEDMTYSQERFPQWCKENNIKRWWDFTTLDKPFDWLGLDAAIEWHGQVLTLQYRFRPDLAWDFPDVTVRKYRHSEGDRSYKIRNVRAFLYGTRTWWVLVDTIFYDEIEPYKKDIRNIDNSSTFDAYHLGALEPYYLGFSTREKWWAKKDKYPLTSEI